VGTTYCECYFTVDTVIFTAEQRLAPANRKLPAQSIDFVDVTGDIAGLSVCQQLNSASQLR
jgi:hypothetical protein